MSSFETPQDRGKAERDDGPSSQQRLRPSTPRSGSPHEITEEDRQIALKRRRIAKWFVDEENASIERRVHRSSGGKRAAFPFFPRGGADGLSGVVGKPTRCLSHTPLPRLYYGEVDEVWYCGKKKEKLFHITYDIPDQEDILWEVSLGRLPDVYPAPVVRSRRPGCPA